MNINFQKFLIQITQDKKKLILTIIVVCVALLLDFNLILKPQKAALRSCNAKIIKIRNDLKSFKSDLDKMQTSVDKPGALKIKKIISADQVSWLIEEIYKLGNQYKVNIKQISPSRQAKPLPGPSAKYNILLLNADISCNYLSLTKFLDALEKHSAVMAIEGLEVIRSKKDFFSQEVNLTIKTYVKK